MKASSGSVHGAIATLKAGRATVFGLMMVAGLSTGCKSDPVVKAPALVTDPGHADPIDGSTRGYALAVSLAIQDNDWKRLDGLLAPDFTYQGDGLKYNRDEYIGFMQDMKLAFTGMKMEFKHVLVDGEFVTIDFTSRAMHVGKFMGAPATHKELAVSGTLIRQIRDGKAIQEWQTTDLLGLMTQMGYPALQGYALGVGAFKAELPRPVRKPVE